MLCRDKILVPNCLGCIDRGNLGVGRLLVAWGVDAKSRVPLSLRSHYLQVPYCKQETCQMACLDNKTYELDPDSALN